MDDSKTGSLSESTKILLESSVLLTAIIYVAGWGYLQGYFSAFGVSLREVNLPTEVALIFALRTFATCWSLVILAATGAVLVTGMTYLPRLRLKWANHLFLVGLILTSGLIWLQRGVSLGHETAKHHMQANDPELPSIIEIQFVDGSSPFAGEKLKLLMQTGDRIYAFRPLDALPSDGSNLGIYVLPQGQVKLMRIQRGVK